MAEEIIISDEDDFWVAFRERIAQNKATRIEKNTLSMHLLCVKYGISKTMFNPNSWRLSKDDLPKLDYYPPSNRAFNHETQKWFTVGKDRLENTLVKHFKLSQ